MLKVWRDKSQAIALLSDDERFMITGFINNIPEGDPRNSYKHWLNGRWNMYEGKWRNEWRKTMPKTEDDKLIAKNLKSKSSILAIAFASGRYKKAVSDFMKTCGKKKGNIDYSDEVGFSRVGMRYFTLDSNESLMHFLRLANKFKFEGFGFTKIEEYVNDTEYGVNYLPSNGTVDYYGVDGLTVLHDYEYHTPLCLGFLTWNTYFNTGYVVIDYMPEYLNIEAWRNLLLKMIRVFFKKHPNDGLLIKCEEDWEVNFCKKIGFAPADLDPDYKMSEYVLYLKDFKDVN